MKKLFPLLFICLLLSGCKARALPVKPPDRYDGSMPISQREKASGDADVEKASPNR